MASTASRIRDKFRRFTGPVLAILAVTYFCYHAIHGDRGLFAWVELKQQVVEAETVSQTVKAERERWEHRVALLGPHQLDLDMLEERARVMLNVGYSQDEVIFYGK